MIYSLIFALTLSPSLSTQEYICFYAEKGTQAVINGQTVNLPKLIKKQNITVEYL